jgi:hypothetical protein
MRDGGWAQTLTPEQALACRKIMGRGTARRGNKFYGRGWRVFMDRSIGSPAYLELRLYDAGGSLSKRWVIEDRKSR